MLTKTTMIETWSSNNGKFKKDLVRYLHKKDTEQTTKEHKAKIDESEHEKLRFPEIEDTTSKIVILELVTKFKRAIMDFEMLNPRVQNELEVQNREE